MHRLIAEFVKGIAPDQLKATQKAVEDVVFEETASYNQSGRPIPLLAWQYHLLSVVDIARAREDAQGARLCSELGQHLFQVGDYDGARPYYEKALSIQRKLYGKSHLEIADSLNRLGYLLHAQGKNEEALPHFKQALTIQNELLGAEDMAIARSLNYIGQIYYIQGDIVAAKTEFERALQISLRLVGDEHSLSAEYINNLGMCLMALNELEEALVYLLRALRINETILGLEHRDIAMGCNNIALVMTKIGRSTEAQPYGERALAIRTKILGDHHPDTGQSFRILGDILFEQADFAGAETCFEQAIQIYHKAYPDGLHPRVGLCLTSLGRLKHQQGALDEAYQFLTQALSIQQTALSKQNVDQAFTLLCLAKLLTTQGKIPQAKKLLRQAGVIYKAARGNYRREVEQIRKYLFSMESTGLS